MKRQVYFITHSTLDEYHARISLESLSRQEYDENWDALFVYNTHQEELSNEKILELSSNFRLDKKFKRIEIVEYDSRCQKTNFQDFMNLMNHCRKNVPIHNRSKVLYLKSDYVISDRFFNGIYKFDGEENFLFSSMIENAKEFVTEEEIKSRARRELFTLVDEVTFYAGSDFRDDHPHSGGIPSNNTISRYCLKEHWNKHQDWFDRGGFEKMKKGPRQITNPTDSSIRFISHACRGDVNVHYMNSETFAGAPTSGSKHHSWGYWQGWNKLIEAGIRILNVPESFGIHVFHEIVSKNRSEPRSDPNKNVKGQRY